MTDLQYMTEPPNPLQTARRFGSFSIAIGLLLALLGLIGIIVPQFISLQAVFLVSGLFIVGGVFWAFHAFKYSWADWLKPALLVISGVLMFIYPMGGIAAIGLLLAVYLLLDAFGSFTIAAAMRPLRGWGWMAFNGLVSLFLAVLFLVGWPSTSLYLVGIYVAISLLFDGISLIYIGYLQRQLFS